MTRKLNRLIIPRVFLTRPWVQLLQGHQNWCVLRILPFKSIGVPPSFVRFGLGLMDECRTCRPTPSAPPAAAVPICHGGKNYEDLLKEDKSELIPFLGNTVDDFTPNALVIVSFPGAYGRAWNFLTKEAAKAESGLNTSCIFLPNSSAPGYGQHIRTGRDGQMCHCTHLYHGQKLALIGEFCEFGGPF